MQKTLCLILTLCLLALSLPMVQAEDSDVEMTLFPEGSDDTLQMALEDDDIAPELSLDFDGDALALDFAGDTGALTLSDEEQPLSNEGGAPSETPEQTSPRYVRFDLETPVYAYKDCAGAAMTLPEGSCALVVDDADGALEIAFAAEERAYTGFARADYATALTPDEVAALIDALAVSGSVLLYGDDLDRPLPRVEPRFADADETQPEDGEGGVEADPETFPDGEGDGKRAADADEADAESSGDPLQASSDGEGDPEQDANADEADAESSGDPLQSSSDGEGDGETASDASADPAPVLSEPEPASPESAALQDDAPQNESDEAASGDQATAGEEDAQGEGNSWEDDDPVDAAGESNPDLEPEEEADIDIPQTDDESESIALLDEETSLESDERTQADAPAEINGPDEGLLVDPEEESCTIRSSKDSDQLFATYANRILQGDSSRMMRSNASSSTGGQLSGQDKLVYDLLKAEIIKVAEGQRSSTIFKVPFATLMGKTEFTASELGVDMPYPRTPETTAQAAAAYRNLYTYSLDAVVYSLWFDCTYELYWLDRYDELIRTTKPGASIIYDKEIKDYVIFVEDDACLQFKFPVLERYAGADIYTVDTSLIAGAKQAKANAKAIVQKYADCSDYVKLYGYAMEICRLANYNYDAVSEEWEKANPQVQDPWKLIWVFDGDSSTNVVCEGFAQAFNYLCELTSFSGNVRCRLVTGYVMGEDHSWNLVHMDDDRNYLVDITWMDNSWDGQSGSLADLISNNVGDMFLCGGDGSIDDGYAIYNRFGEYWGTRLYRYDTLILYSASQLTLADSHYVLTGFQKIHGNTYYFDEFGKYVTGKQLLDGYGYNFKSNGVLKGTLSGWHTIGGEKCFFEKDGKLHTKHTVVKDPAITATCTKPGKTEGSHCSVCQTVLTPQERVPATGHTPVVDPAVMPTCTSRGLTEGSHCATCGKILVRQKKLSRLDFAFHMKKNASKKVNVGVPIQIVVDGKKVKSYKSSNKSVAKVNRNGWVTTLKAGKTKITIKLKNGKKLTLRLTVVDPSAPKSIKIEQGSRVNLKVGKKLTLTAQVNPSKAKTKLTWKSSDKKVATVNSKGVVTGKKKGTAIIVVTTDNGKAAFITVNVKS